MILIDPPLWPWRGRVWSHLVSDVSYAELHAFADRLGVPPRAFDRDHYDVPAEMYEKAIAAGAEPVGCQELLTRLTRAGLRRRKPRRPRAPSAPEPS
ncbi:DUF4031 domain-containing protein [Actinomadura craniellae]|uniref:DUF4031 domain-containing protein n=1 Tax=Actinomadura craniellae TaxID=2231787 RepID=A0A365H2R9_9ACTN|nr:DUF4031 domain-containing protein [Actinomadura craniellae]RAY13316.1 DUF4031 domain-containing protein [Actinomadura craniellae]